MGLLNLFFEYLEGNASFAELSNSMPKNLAWWYFGIITGIFALVSLSIIWHWYAHTNNSRIKFKIITTYVMGSLVVLIFFFTQIEQLLKLL